MRGAHHAEIRKMVPIRPKPAEIRFAVSGNASTRD